MSIQPLNEKWLVTWHKPPMDELIQARAWLYELWHNDWGSISILDSHSDHLRKAMLVFHRLDHANWFMLKWS
jgi:hypothetical protein